MSGTWFFAYRLYDHGYRGTADLQPGDLKEIQKYFPSAHHKVDWGLTISENDLHALFEAVDDDPTDLNMLWHPHSKHVFSPS